MSEYTVIPRDILFGSIFVHPAPPRWEGNTAYLRSRVIETGYEGKVLRDEIVESGVAIENAGLWPQFFYLLGPSA